MSKVARRVLIVVGVIVAVLVAVFLCLNIYVRSVYSDFYEAAEPAFPIPAVSDGFIDQDLDYFDRNDVWLFSGYMTKGGPSPIYRRTAGGDVSCVYTAYPDGTPYEGHAGGITSSDNYVFLACEEGYLVLPAGEVMDAPDGGTVQAVDVVQLEVQPAFLNIEDDTLFCGNFYRDPEYPSPDHYKRTAPDGTLNQAVMYAYPADAEAPYGFALQADRVYSIPDLVQGMCITDSQHVVLSTSWGIGSSHLLVYRLADLPEQDIFMADGREVPLFFLDSSSLVDDIEAPPMTEGIEYHEGRVYIGEESASNKYVFGKLYGAGIVFSLPL